MKSGINFLRPLTQALLLTLAALCTSMAHADIYGDVSKLIASGQLADAETRADRHLQTKPRDPQMRYFKGVIQRETGRTADALDTFTQLTVDYPELPEPYNAMAVLLAAQGSYKPALEALEKAIRANPGYAVAHQNLGDVYARMAQQAYCKARQLDPANTELTARLSALGLTCPGPTAP
jgi:Flp pilus assembly protein TadD